MGGNPKLLSRASKIEDYIKNGKEQADISIVLYIDKTSKTTFRRIFNKNGKSEWMVIYKLKYFIFIKKIFSD